MKSSLAWICVLATSGCFVVPQTSTTSRQAGTVTSDLRFGVARSLALTTVVERGTISVHAIRTRDCTRDVYRVTEVTETKHLRLGGVEDPRGRVFGAMLAPVTLPVSLLISGLIVAADDGATRRVQKLERVAASSCTQPAERLRVTVELASGQRFERITDERGTITFRIPDGEPYRGMIVARAETQSVELMYKRRMPAVTAVREAVTSCAEQHGLTGALDVRIVVNERGLPTKVELDRGDAPLTTCITSEIARLQFSERDRGTTVVLPFQLGS